MVECYCGSRLTVEDHNKREAKCLVCGISFIYPIVSNAEGIRIQVQKAVLTKQLILFSFNDDLHWEPRDV